MCVTLCVVSVLRMHLLYASGRTAKKSLLFRTPRSLVHVASFFTINYGSLSRKTAEGMPHPTGWCTCPHTPCRYCGNACRRPPSALFCIPGICIFCMCTHSPPEEKKRGCVIQESVCCMHRSGRSPLSSSVSHLPSPPLFLGIPSVPSSSPCLSYHIRTGCVAK